MRKPRADDLSASFPDYLNLISGFGKARVLDSKSNTLNRGNGFYMAIEMQITMKNSYDEMGKFPYFFQSRGQNANNFNTCHFLSSNDNIL